MLNVLKRLFGSKRGQTEQSVTVLDVEGASLTALSAPNAPSSPQAQQIQSVAVSPAMVVNSTELSSPIIFPTATATGVLDRPEEFSCVRFVYDIMDELWQPDDASIPQRVRKEIRRLGDDYDTLNQRSDIQYDTPLRRLAYLYAYATVRATVIGDIFQHCEEAPLPQDRDVVRIASIGGGPCTDIIGLVKYLAASGSRRRIEARIYDREAGWEDICRVGASKLQKWADCGVVVVEGDFTDQSASAMPRIAEADLYTISYCLSQFHERHEQAQQFFARLFQDMPREAYCLYLDQNHVEEYGWFDELAASHHLVPVPFLKGRTSNQREMFMAPTIEAKAANECYRGVLSPKPPRLDLKISYRLCQKQ